jgi:two-component system LytT family response regulator
MLIWVLDDENLQLNMLTRTILEAEPDAAVVSFSAAPAALDKLNSGQRPDVVFTDIEMPGISGIELAKRIKLTSPHSNIVFVTGFSQYALDAVAMHASGYVMKPPTAERIRAELDDLRNPVRQGPPARLRVQTFGNFEVFVDGSVLDFKSAKAKELFALLIDRRGAGLTTAEIAAILWEEREYSVSLKNQVQKIISLMRTALASAGCADILVKGHNRTAIDAEKVSCDLYDFFKGDLSSINSFTGEYMSQYSWAEFTNGFLYGQVTK